MIAKKELTRLGLLLLGANAIAIAVHLGVLAMLDRPLWQFHLKEAYLFNAFFAFQISAAIFMLREKFTSSLGFLFLAGTFLKFIVFFLFFWPMYQEDGDMSKAEFLTFFVPYIVNLFVETFFLVRVLNRLD